MTRDDIIRMAMQVGCTAHEARAWERTLTEFAALVVAAEREACAQVCDRGAEQMLHAYKREGAARCAASIRAMGEPATRKERRAHDERYLLATVEQTRTGRFA